MPNTTDSTAIQSGWLMGLIEKRRSKSESEGSSSIKLDILSWLTGNGRVNTDKLLERRASSKDIEEAMAGGLSKVITMLLL